MKYRIFFTLILIFILSVGCENKEIPINPVEITTTTSSKDVVKVKEIKIKNAPPNAESPSEAIIHQYEVNFTNGSKLFPNKDSILTETTLGNNSILTIRSPEGEKNYSAFLYKHDNNQWLMEGLVRLEFYEKEYFTDDEGLNLPMDKFNVAKIDLEDKNLWAFIDEKNIVTIAKFNQYPFEEKTGIRKTLLNNRDVNIGGDNYGNKYLYYYDTGKIVVVSGNISEKDIIAIAQSIPSVTSPDFPSPSRNY